MEPIEPMAWEIHCFASNPLQNPQHLVFKLIQPVSRSKFDEPLIKDAPVLPSELPAVLNEALRMRLKDDYQLSNVSAMKSAEPPRYSTIDLNPYVNRKLDPFEHMPFKPPDDRINQLDDNPFVAAAKTTKPLPIQSDAPVKRSSLIDPANFV